MCCKTIELVAQGDVCDDNFVNIKTSVDPVFLVGVHTYVPKENATKSMIIKKNSITSTSQSLEGKRAEMLGKKLHYI